MQFCPIGFIAGVNRFCFCSLALYAAPDSQAKIFPAAQNEE
jgi:hypothetical protein